MYKHPDKRDKSIRMRIKTLKFQFDKKQRGEKGKLKNNYPKKRKLKLGVKEMLLNKKIIILINI